MTTKTKSKTRPPAEPAVWSFAECVERIEQLRDGLGNGSCHPNDPDVHRNLRTRPIEEQLQLGALLNEMSVESGSGAWLLRNRLARAEAAEQRELRKSGATDLPATPYLFALQRGHADMTKTTATPSKRTSGRTGTPRTVKEPDGAFYTHDGKMCSRHRFSTVAYFYSLGIEGAGKRLGAKEFRQHLIDNGIANPDVPPWSIELSNGVVLAFHAAGDKVDLAPSATKAKRATSKATPAKRTTTAKPAPKKQTAKARAASAAKKPAPALGAKKSTQRTASKPVGKIVPRKTTAAKPGKGRKGAR